MLAAMLDVMLSKDVEASDGIRGYHFSVHARRQCIPRIAPFSYALSQTPCFNEEILPIKTE